MKRLIVLIVALAAAVALIVPPGALADGDPGSDELVYQTFFSGAEDNISTAQQTAMSKLLYATTALKASVRVAVIGQEQDLGTVTQLWRKPEVYAQYLGEELEDAYDGRLIVVMPQGVAFYWYRHGVEMLPSIATGKSPDQLMDAANAAVAKVEAMAGISTAKLAAAAHSKTVEQAALSVARQSASGAIATSAAPTAAAEPKAGSSATNVSPVIMVFGLLVVLSAVFWAPPLWRRRGALKQGGIALPGLAVGVGALGALAILAVVIHSSQSSTASGETLATNPDIASVTSLGDNTAAPAFTLTDESGHPISLKQYRGKVVILSFTDDECQTICPLTTQAMVDARDALGADKKDVELLGIDANPRSTSIQDVESYTQLHGMLGQWHFLTGSLAQLKKTWIAYHVDDDISTYSNIIDHTPALFIIGPDGRLRGTALTYTNYAAIPQFGQELAAEASSLLPDHPKVQTHYSYATIKGISPSTKTTLAKVGGGTVTLGTGKPHLYLFFATWDQQSTALAAQMTELNAYALEAKRLGLPPLTAIDEGAVEPNPDAVKQFLAGLHLDYPVAVDTTGQLADGYGVEGEPWFTLAVPSAKNTVSDPTANTPWTQEVYTQGWPSLATLKTSIPAALKPATASSTSAEVAKDLAGSPPALAALHRQASQLLAGGGAALVARLKALRGHPVVINVWASDCAPCQQEFGWFATESATYGAKVGFLGVDYDDLSQTDAEGFLARHHVSYPSYAISDGALPGAVLPGGVEGTPTTVFLNAAGKLVYVQTGEYSSEQQFDQQIQSYALGG